MSALDSGIGVGAPALAGTLYINEDEGLWWLRKRQEC